MLGFFRVRSFQLLFGDSELKDTARKMALLNIFERKN
jgi:hypothetical protein